MDDLKYKVTASGRTDAELLDVIDKREKYLPETIEASVAELQFRKYPLTDEFLKVIELDVAMHRSNADIPGRRLSNYKNNIVEDPDAPLFYSRRVVYTFGFLFGTLFGSILMAMNMSRTNNPARMVWVVLFGTVFTALQIALVESTGTGRSAGIIFSLVGAMTLESFFWNRYIGNATFYRARPIWIPLIIGLVITALIFISIFYGPQA